MKDSKSLSEKWRLETVLRIVESLETGIRIEIRTDRNAMSKFTKGMSVGPLLLQDLGLRVQKFAYTFKQSGYIIDAGRGRFWSNMKQHPAHIRAYADSLRGIKPSALDRKILDNGVNKEKIGAIAEKWRYATANRILKAGKDSTTALVDVRRESINLQYPELSPGELANLAPRLSSSATLMMRNGYLVRYDSGRYRNPKTLDLKALEMYIASIRPVATVDQPFKRHKTTVTDLVVPVQKEIIETAEVEEGTFEMANTGDTDFGKFLQSLNRILNPEDIVQSDNIALAKESIREELLSRIHAIVKDEGVNKLINAYDALSAY